MLDVVSVEMTEGMAKNDDLIRRAMSELARRRAAKLSRTEISELSRKAARALWANLTPEERSAEMKRRAEVRKRNRAKTARKRQRK